MMYDQYMYVARHDVNVPIERLVPFDEFPPLLRMQYVLHLMTPR